MGDTRAAGSRRPDSPTMSGLERIVNGKRRIVIAAAALAAAPAVSLAQSVQLENLSWEFYHGGYAQADSSDFETVQDHWAGRTSHEVARALGGASFRSSSLITAGTLTEGPSQVVSVSFTMVVEAEVAAGSPGGLAHAFAGLSLLSFDVLLSDVPHAYSGSLSLFDAQGAEYSGGMILNPGTYSYFQYDPFAVDVATSYFVLPGNSEYRLERTGITLGFTPVPAPASLAMLGMAGLVAARRRR